MFAQKKLHVIKKDTAGRVKLSCERCCCNVWRSTEHRSAVGPRENGWYDMSFRVHYDRSVGLYWCRDRAVAMQRCPNRHIQLAPVLATRLVSRDVPEQSFRARSFPFQWLHPCSHFRLKLKSDSHFFRIEQFPNPSHSHSATHSRHLGIYEELLGHAACQCWPATNSVRQIKESKRTGDHINWRHAKHQMSTGKNDNRVIFIYNNSTWNFTFSESNVLIRISVWIPRDPCDPGLSHSVHISTLYVRRLAMSTARTAGRWPLNVVTNVLSCRL